MQNIVWFLPLDLIKFAMRATVIKTLRKRQAAKEREAVAALSRGVPIHRTQSRAASVHESLYSNRVGFLRRAARKAGFGGKVRVRPDELQRFGSIQAQSAGATLARNPSRQAA
jgi:H+-transporting ATPase